MCEEGSLEEMKLKAHTLCKEYLNGAWADITPEQMVFRKVSGGLSNLLYYCGLPEGVETRGQEPDRLLMRLYGKANEANAMEALVYESVIFALLSESQRGPKLYGVFPGGRLEQFIPARALVTKELCDPLISETIAEKMAHIHQMDVPISKTPKWLWDTMDSWFENISKADQIDLSTDQRKLFAKIDKMNLSNEIKWLKEYLLAIKSPVVFCHNDLQEGNILLLDEPPLDYKPNGNCLNRQSSENKIHNALLNDNSGESNAVVTKPNILVIDYEYCSYNYRGFDLANHFCEWVYDYSNEQPPYFFEHFDHICQEKQDHFLRCYLKSLKEGVGYQESSRDTLECLREEAQVFTLASHFFWALWSVANSTTSTITFDYSGYAEARFEAYFKHKRKLVDSSSVA